MFAATASCALAKMSAPSEVTNARYRSHCPEQTLHVRRPGDGDRHLRRHGGAQDPNRHFSEHRHSSRRRRMDLRRIARRRYVKTRDLLLRAHAQQPSQRHRAYRVAVPAAVWDRQGLLSARRQHQRRARANDGGLADRSEVPATGNYAALRSQLQRLERACHSTGAVEPRALPGRSFTTRVRISFDLNSRRSQARRFRRPTGARFYRSRSTSINKSCKPTDYRRRMSSTRSASRTS